MDKAELKKRTKEFAHRCVNLALHLPEGTLGYHLRSQLIRCSTSVAANYRAACMAQSRNAFAAKLAIVIEEDDETCFWLEFIIEENIFSETKIQALLNEANELTAIFVASRRTLLNNKS